MRQLYLGPVLGDVTDTEGDIQNVPDLDGRSDDCRAADATAGDKAA